MKFFKRILFAAFLGLVALAALNFTYLWKNLSYYIQRPEPVHVESFQQPGTAREKMEPDTLVIESLGIKTPVLYVSEVNEKKFEETLAGGIVHYPGTAALGELGNSYIFGNSSDYPWAPGGRFKTIFALLPKIKAGEEIMVSNPDGDKFVYKVIETKIVAPTEMSVLDQRNYEKKLLSLQTCWPVGTALKRFVVVAELVE